MTIIKYSYPKSNTTFDTISAINFIYHHYTEIGGRYFFISTKDRSGIWHDHGFRNRWPRVANDVLDLINRNLRNDIYMSAMTFRRPYRRAAYVSEHVNILYADLDPVRPETLEMTPSVAWRTSKDRFQCFWYLDDRVSIDEQQERNRHLTYEIGADPSGWDRTQVLRVPFTKNRKYRPAHRVSLLWSGGPVYSPNEFPLPKKSPPRPQVKVREKGIPDDTRRLLEARVSRGDRSAVFWRIVNDLVEAGFSEEEIFALVSPSVWAEKYSDDQIRRQIERAFRKIAA